MSTPRVTPSTSLTAAEIRHAEKAATRPDGTLDAGLFGAAIARPFGIRRRMALRQLEAVAAELTRAAPVEEVPPEAPTATVPPRRRVG